MLRIHRNLFHKPATQLVPVLQRAGVPLRTLDLCKPALDMCVDCRRWAKVGTKPSVSVQISKKFGEVVYTDLVFLGEWIFQVFVDQATRFTRFGYLESKEFTSIEKGYRRTRFANHGHPRYLVSDKESAVASEQFGVWCEGRNIERQLISAKDDKTRLGVVSRACQGFRNTVPMIIAELGREGIKIEPKDVAAEVAMVVNTQVSDGGFTPHMMVHGCHPFYFIARNCP